MKLLCVMLMISLSVGELTNSEGQGCSLSYLHLGQHLISYANGAHDYHLIPMRCVRSAVLT